jgi:hypothetical protein
MAFGPAREAVPFVRAQSAMRLTLADWGLYPGYPFLSCMAHPMSP